MGATLRTGFGIGKFQENFDNFGAVLDVLCKKKQLELKAETSQKIGIKPEHRRHPVQDRTTISDEAGGGRTRV